MIPVAPSVGRYRLLESNNMSNRLFVYGFPGLYGGAATELHHQIILWRKLGVRVHLIPTDAGYRNEPLYRPMLERGVVVHEAHDFSTIRPGDPVLGFCNEVFLDRLPEICKHSRNTVFINCMTWLFEREKQRMKEGLIGTFLYQNEEVRVEHERTLRALNPDPQIRFLTFRPYFEAEAFPFVLDRSRETFGVGRISRQDADKFSAQTLQIYEGFVSPVLKRGLFLGFDSRSEEKVGKPFDWIRVAQDQREVSQQSFYRGCDVVLQPTDTKENWPRIGLEAMASGSVLIVDNRGGWRRMVEHGVTGWLCDHERDFIYYASKMAYEPVLRRTMARVGRRRLDAIAGTAVSSRSWASVLARLGVQVEV